MFAAVPGPWALWERRYGLRLLLTCLVAALLCNCDTAAGKWCAAQRALPARRSPRQRALTPTGALCRWLLPRLPVADREPLALNGKAVRKAAVVGPDGTRAAPHLLSISGHATRLD